MEHQERIELTDSQMTACMKLAEGNPGAISALMKMMAAAPTIDPDSAWGSFGPLFALDMLGIYGSRIWQLWKDVCGCDAVKSETLFRGVQLGIVPGSLVRDAASSGTHSFDFAVLLANVQEQLPAFGEAKASA